ncbi:MAG TPA: flagellar export protein FliJ [Pseudobdellovibrionaceae bacterium]|jgi:flagellar FliJ protein
MKFKFPLQKVLDHRKIKEDLAQKDFHDVLNELQILQKKLQELEVALHEAHVRSGSLQSQGGTQGPALSQINEFQKNQKILIQLQKTKILAQEKVVEGKRELLLQAAVETKTINKFKEKKFNEYREEREADEQKEMDEQNILRFKPFSKRE